MQFNFASTIFVILAAAAVVLSASFDLVMGDVRGIEGQFNHLTNETTEFGTKDTPTYDEFIAIHDLIETTTNTIGRAASNLNDPPTLKPEEQNQLCAAFKNMASIETKFLAVMVAKLEDVETVVFPGPQVNPAEIVQKALLSLQKSQRPFFKALLGIVAPTCDAAMQTQITETEDALYKAIDTYST